MNDSELLQLAKGWGNFASDRINIWRLQHSYDFLVESFTKNWESHIESLDKYNGKKDLGIFLVEYTDDVLHMFENVYEDWIDGMSQGDMREEETFNCYRLSRDKKMLNYIYKYRDRIKYVIFVYDYGFEAIRLENIPYLFKLHPWKYTIYPITAVTVSSLYGNSIKMP